jgi:mono/diheme cytochrome c family protein
MKIFRGFIFAAPVVFAVTTILSATRLVGQATQVSKPSKAQAGNIENGKRVFTRYGCYECHGREGQGSAVTGPRVGPDPIPFEVFTQYIRKPAGGMPPYTDKVLSDQELIDIYAFLQSLPQPSVIKSTAF